MVGADNTTEINVSPLQHTAMSLIICMFQKNPFQLVFFIDLSFAIS